MNELFADTIAILLTFTRPISPKKASFNVWIFTPSARFKYTVCKDSKRRFPSDMLKDM